MALFRVKQMIKHGMIYDIATLSLAIRMPCRCRHSRVEATFGKDDIWEHVARMSEKRIALTFHIFIVSVTFGS